MFRNHMLVHPLLLLLHSCNITSTWHHTNTGMHIVMDLDGICIRLH